MLSIENKTTAITAANKAFAAKTKEMEESMKSLDEEMRVCYVALTRAQHSVIMIGAGREEPKPFGGDFYSWQDQVLQARDELEGAQAEFIFRAE